MFGPQKMHPSIVHLDLNDSTVISHKISSSDRTPFAKILETLRLINPEIIGVDIVFSDPPCSVTNEIAKISRKTANIYFPVIPLIHIPKAHQQQFNPLTREILLINPTVVGADKLISPSSIITPSSDILSASAGLGHIYCEPDRDGVYRRIPLILKYMDGFVPSFSLRMALDILNVKNSDIIIIPGKYLILKNCSIYGKKIIRDIKIPINKKGEMLINYPAPWAKHFDHYSVDTILKIDQDAEQLSKMRTELEGSIIFVSDISSRGKDHGPNPFESVYPLSGIHSSVLNSILTENFLHDQPPYTAILSSFVLMLIIFLLSFLRRTDTFLLASSISLLLFIISLFVIFILANIRINILLPSITGIFCIFIATIIKFIRNIKMTVEEKLQLNNLGLKFLPDGLIKLVSKSGIEDLKVGDRTTDTGTIIVCELKGFGNSLLNNERILNNDRINDSDAVQKLRFELLNSYFNLVCPSIRESGGVICAFNGDQIIALFRDKLSDAIDTAAKIMALENDLLKIADRYLMGKLAFGICIDHGAISVGVAGDQCRHEFIVDGYIVGNACRIVKLTRTYGVSVIMTKTAADLVKCCSDKPQRKIGISTINDNIEPLHLYELLIRSNKKNSSLSLLTKMEFETAVDHFISGNYDEAQKSFLSIVALDPNDEVSKYYLREIELIQES